MSPLSSKVVTFSDDSSSGSDSVREVPKSKMLAVKDTMELSLKSKQASSSTDKRRIRISDSTSSESESETPTDNVHKPEKSQTR